MSPAFARFLRYRFPAILWSAMILSASGSKFSSPHSGSWLEHLLGGSISPEALYILNHMVRKASHLVEYGILSWLMFRALRSDAAARWKLLWAVFAVALATSVAGIDEWHQTLIPSRTGTFADVVVDAAGATVAQLLIRLIQLLF